MAEVRRKRHSRGRRSLWSRLTAMASSQSNEPRSIRWTRTVSEALIIAMSCLAPWAFGATEAWAELVLYAGVLAVTALTVYADRGSDRATRMTSVPSLALAGLVMLALVQATPLPRWLTRCISPASVSRLERLVPAVPERIVSDPESVVPPPASTLSLDPEASRITAAKLAAAWLLFQAVCALGGGYSTLSRFGTAMLVNCGGLAVFSIVQAVGWNGKLYWMRPSPGGAGPFVCHNHLAAYLNLGLGFGGATLLVWARRRTPWSESRLVDTLMYWPIYTTSLIMAAVFTSLSRGGLMAMVGAGLCAAIYLRPRKWSRSLTVTIVAIACLAGVMLIISGSSESFQARALTVLEQDSYVGRVEIWWAAIQAWARQPFWGTGMGTLSYALAPYLSINGHVARAENEYIDLLSEGGVIGITLGVALLVGIARLGIRAYRLAPQSADRCLLRGALFSGVTLIIHSLCDFGMHIPAVALPAIVLSAHLCRLGRKTRGQPLDTPSGVPWRARSLNVAGRVALVAVGGVLLVHGYRMARAEAYVSNAGFPLSGFGRPRMVDAPGNEAELTRSRVALEKALSYRPNWSDAHLQLGLVHLGLYRQTAARWLREGTDSDAPRDVMADPLWLLTLVHPPDDAAPITAAELVAEEPIREYLVPAARCFLQARRCRPASADVQARLSSLCFLFDGNYSAAQYAEGAWTLTGGDDFGLNYLAKVTSLSGSPELAARYWRKSLAVAPDGWEPIADAAAVVLSPEEILSQVAPDGRSALNLANRLYGASEDRPIRQAYLREVLRRLPGDRGLAVADRLWFEAEAWAGLDAPAQAITRMEEAVTLDLKNDSRRHKYIEALLEAGRPEQAYQVAMVGRHIGSNPSSFEPAIQTAADAVARGAQRTVNEGPAPDPAASADTSPAAE